MRSLIFAVLAVVAGMVAFHAHLPEPAALSAGMVWSVGLLLLWMIVEEEQEQ